jgi:hypothetical protein
MQAGADDYLTKPFLHVNCLLGSAQDSKLRGYNTNGSKFAAADLETMTRLHELGTHFVRPGNEVQKCLDATLETAILLTGAAKGSLQRLDEASGKLKIVAQRGFNESFLKFFATVSDRDSADFWGNVGAPPQGISNP